MNCKIADANIGKQLVLDLEFVGGSYVWLFFFFSVIEILEHWVMEQDKT